VTLWQWLGAPAHASSSATRVCDYLGRCVRCVARRHRRSAALTCSPAVGGVDKPVRLLRTMRALRCAQAPSVGCTDLFTGRWRRGQAGQGAGGPARARIWRRARLDVPRRRVVGGLDGRRRAKVHGRLPGPRMAGPAAIRGRALDSDGERGGIGRRGAAARQAGWSTPVGRGRYVRTRCARGSCRFGWLVVSCWRCARTAFVSLVCVLAFEWITPSVCDTSVLHRKGSVFPASRMALLVCAYDLCQPSSILSSDGTSYNSKPCPRSGLRQELLPKQEQANLPCSETINFSSGSAGRLRSR
jgi:hypothetical protein